MKKIKKWILAAVILAVLGCTVQFMIGYILPWYRAGSAMPEQSELTIAEQDDGTLRMFWTAAEKADRYCLEILLPAEEEEEPEVFHCEYAQDPSCVLPTLPGDICFTFRITSIVDYENPAGPQSRRGDDPLEVSTALIMPEMEAAQWTADPDSDRVHMEFHTQNSDFVQARLFAGEELLAEWDLTEPSLDIGFGTDGEFPVPEYGASCTLRYQAVRQEGNIRFCGPVREDVTLEREDFLGRDLKLTCTDLGDNVCCLAWEETKGESYQVQRWDGQSEQWETLWQGPVGGEYSYTTGHLAPSSQYTFRVAAVGGQTMENSEYAAVSEEVSFATGCSPTYATIWPITALDAYTDTGKTEILCQVSAGKAYCVLEEIDGLFAISVDGTLCYIDSNYCMINLPEYMGGLCSYKITNSYASIYMVHEFEIPRVTNVVTAGYEQVRLADGSFLVPLLYPTARKLAVAAENAAAQGYRLKIYDSFRPYQATRQIYDRTAAILDKAIPSRTFTGVSIGSLNLPEPEEDAELTYRDVMTNETYQLNSFLAKGGSAHNQGVALDLTLEDIATGQEQRMQTSMHDLSRYSVLGRNNSKARTLSGIMTEAGFGTLISEWWHFQDNDARNTLSLPYFAQGISCEGWIRDDNGWRYRKANGACYQDTSVTIDGTQYSFDTEGYVSK